MRVSVWITVLGIGCAPAAIECPEGATAATFAPRQSACEPMAEPPCPLVLESDATSRMACVYPELDSVTLAYVVDFISVPPPSLPDATGRSTALGFDLDGLDSGAGANSSDATCEEIAADYLGTEPGVVGVDNALTDLIPTFEGTFQSEECPGGDTRGCLDVRLLADIRRGALLLVLELTDVDSYEDDADVGATLYSVRTEDGAAMQLDGPTDDPTARAVPDQGFVVVEARTESVRASILHGRLQALWPALTLPQSGLGYPDQYTEVELRADVGDQELSNGVMGALVSVDVFFDEMVERGEPYLDFIRTVLEGVADVNVGGRIGTCTDISAGYALHGMPAQLVR